MNVTFFGMKNCELLSRQVPRKHQKKTWLITYWNGFGRFLIRFSKTVLVVVKVSIGFSFPHRGTFSVLSVGFFCSPQSTTHSSIFFHFEFYERFSTAFLYVGEVLDLQRSGFRRRSPSFETLQVTMALETFEGTLYQPLRDGSLLWRLPKWRGSSFPTLA